MAIHIFYLASFKFCSGYPFCSRAWSVFQAIFLLGKEYHRCQNSLNKDFAFRSMGPRLVPGQGESCLSPRTKWPHRVLRLVFLLQWWFQNCLVESHPAKALLKKYVYKLRRHISLGWLLGIHTATQKKPRSSLAALIMSAVLKLEFQGRTKHHSPAQKAGWCRFSISLPTVLPVCHSQGAPCRASQVPRDVGVCLCPLAQPRGFAGWAVLRALHHSRAFAGAREQLI